MLTPRMAEVLTRIARAKRPGYHHLSPQQARVAYRMGAEILDLPRAPLARVQALTLPGPAGDMPARLYAPSDEVLPVLLYLHGGGFTIGGLDTHDSLCRQFALRAGVAVVSLDYRLAPEHPFPAAVDDTLAAMRWLALQLLITPGTTARCDTESHARFAKGFLLDAEAIAWFFDHYATDAQRDDWRFAPLLADDHEGVAPACVLLAEADPLVDEGVAYADRLRAAGVPVQLELFRGVTHDFIKMGRAIPEALDAQALCAQALREALLETP